MRSVTIGITSEYILYEDGTLYSKKLKRNMAKMVTNAGAIHKYCRYLIDRRKFYINRLVMFYFGDHDFQKLALMGNVYNLDGNHFNNHINNLTFKP